jgi:thiol:disulfide interchange protein DsbD
MNALRALAAVLFPLLLLVSPPVCAVNESDLLEPDKAFRISVRALDPEMLEVRYRIADGYYLYREKFKFAAEQAGVKLGAPQFPPGLVHEDKFFGRTETYRGEVRIRLPVAAAGGVERFSLKAESQGCADVGVCYVPHEQKAAVNLAAVSMPGDGAGKGGALARLGVAQPEDRPDAPGGSPGAYSGDESRFVDVLESGKLGWTLLFFFGAGLALTFTPCVLPMIPILSGIIVGEGRRATRKRAFALSVSYVLGMAVTYTAIGVAAAYSGQLLSAALQNAWVLSAFAGLFVLLALSMFGLYELRIPRAVHAKLSSASQRLTGGHYGAVVVMGALSAAIVSPCIAAPLAGALLYIGQSNDVWLGGTALLSMALGMGAPLVAVGVSEGALLPKSGAWMNAVKHFFGVMLLAVAIWVITPVIPAAAQLLAWSALLIGSGVFLHALDRLPHDARPSLRVGRALGLMALIAGAAMLVGALAGARDPLAPLSGLRLGGADAPERIAFQRVASLQDLETRLAAADRPVMLDFYADWCVTCKEMERFTFVDERVRAALARVLLLQADVTRNTDEDKALLKRFRLFGPPGIVFFDAAGREIAGLRVIGYQNPQRFLRTLENLR